MSPRPRILALRYSALGDVLLAQSALADLKRSLPAADVTWAIDPRWKIFADAIPGLRVLPLKKPSGLLDYFRFKRQLHGERFDVLLAMQASLRINLLYPFVPASRKIGFDQRRARDFHRRFVNESIDRRDEHLLDGFRQFAARAGAELSDPPTWPLMPTPTTIQEWWREQRVPDAYVAIQIGASKLERCWPAERYAELARLFANNPNLGVVLTGGNSEHEQHAARAFEHECPRSLNLAGKTDLVRLRHVLRSALVVVSPDTAAVHFARADEVPVVGLYAVARPELSGPYRQIHYTVDKYPEAVAQLAQLDPASVDWHFRVHHPQAMSLITASDVWTQVQRALFDRSQSRES